jgi:hypothetical protein
MSRDQQKQIAQTGIDNSKTDQSNAQTALGSANAGLDTFNSRLSSYYANDPYTKGGQFDQDQKTINASGANASSNALQSELQMTSKRSGENTGSFAPTLAKTQQEGVMAASDAQAKSDAARIAGETGYQQTGLTASEFPVTASNQQYATSLGGANNSLSVANPAAQAPGFWDWLSNQGAKVAGQAATGAAGA